MIFTRMYVKVMYLLHAFNILLKSNSVIFYFNSISKLNKRRKNCMSCKRKKCAHTSSTVATKASKVLRDGRTSNISKSVAGSALRQKRK